MYFRHLMLITGVLYFAGAAAQAQQPDAQAPPVIRAETRMVLVDAVVTDKKGNYIRDLEAKDFRVWEDNKEVSIKSFSFEANPNSPPGSQKRYLVLFFDVSTMDPADQIRARDAASKFIDANAGPNRVMAIANYGGTLQIAQNFTADAERLKKVVSGIKFSSVSPNAPPEPVEVASLGMPSLHSAAADFGVYSLLLALRSMAKNLATVPGRKTLVLFSSGFPLSAEYQSELTATIDACNKANVAVYPIDVRGLVASLMTPSDTQVAHLSPASLGYTADTFRAIPLFRFGSYSSTLAFMPQHGGGGGGGGGGAGGGGGGGGGGRGGAGGGTGGGTGGGGGGGKGGGGGTGGGGGGGGKGGGGGTGGGGGRGGGGGGGGRGTIPGQPYATNPYNLARQIVPQFPESATTNQQVLYALADGTGGFVIVNTNDLLGGLEKIGKEQNEVYILGYSPAQSPEGSCHTLKVKVDRGGTLVRSRSGYCNVKPVDLLAGNPAEKDLESRVTGAAPGSVKASLQAPFFYTSPNTARVNVALEIQPDDIKFEKVKGKFHASMNVLGIAYKEDGAVAARFSDTVKLQLENKKEVESFKERPLHYENQFEIAAGQYNLKIAFSSGGESFGKAETPLNVDPYDGKQFSLSAVAFSREIHRVSDLESGLDAELIEGHTPLVSQGAQVTPSGSNRFKKSEPTFIYLEIYEPALAAPNPPMVGVQIRILDRKTGQEKDDSGVMNVGNAIRAGNPVVPVALKLTAKPLDSGAYRAEFKAMDSSGRSSNIRSVDFDVD